MSKWIRETKKLQVDQTTSEETLMGQVIRNQVEKANPGGTMQSKFKDTLLTQKVVKSVLISR